MWLGSFTRSGCEYTILHMVTDGLPVFCYLIPKIPHLKYEWARREGMLYEKDYNNIFRLRSPWNLATRNVVRPSMWFKNWIYTGNHFSAQIGRILLRHTAKLCIKFWFGCRVDHKREEVDPGTTVAENSVPGTFGARGAFILDRRLF